MKDLHRIYNPMPVTASDIRFGNIIMANGISHVVNGISPEAVEAIPLLGGVEYRIYKYQQLAGYQVITPFRNIVADMLFKENGFVIESDTRVHKKFPDGSVMQIHLDYYRDKWTITYEGANHSVFHIHEFQNLYHILIREDLTVKPFKNVLS